MTDATTSGSPALLLFPTELERERFRDQGSLPTGLALPFVCGFGPVAAAARTAELVRALRPRRVVLVGIAGAYDDERHPPGSALAFSRVAIDGVGVGEGERFLGPPRVGFPQWPGSKGGPGSDDTPRIEDVLALEPPAARDDGLLLTTCAASDSPEHAALRLARFPEAVAEDMEGFAVACACALGRTPCTVVRGISNRAGQRDPKRWRIPAALAAARRLVAACLEEDRWSSPGRGRSE